LGRIVNATTIAANLATVRAQIAAACVAAGRAADSVQLLAVSKTHPADAVRAAHAAGQRAFGENRVQELLAKADSLTALRDLLRVPGLALVHSLDRERLADELQRELARVGRSLDVLLQVHATGEASKHGCLPEAVPALLEHVRTSCPRLAVQGLMAMGPLEGDPAPVFAAVVALRERLRAASGLPLPLLSLGMSGDFAPAIAAGSTMVRIGSAVFGARAVE
jgi:PLP dependent protein